MMGAQLAWQACRQPRPHAKKSLSSEEEFGAAVKEALRQLNDGCIAAEPLAQTRRYAEDKKRRSGHTAANAAQRH